MRTLTVSGLSFAGNGSVCGSPPIQVKVNDCVAEDAPGFMAVALAVAGIVDGE